MISRRADTEGKRRQMSWLVPISAVAIVPALWCLPSFAGNSPRTYNPNVQSNIDYVYGCPDPNTLDKAINVGNAGRLDLVRALGCLLIPPNTEVTLMDGFGDFYKQVLWEANGQALALWTIGSMFKDARDRAVSKECGSTSASECADRVMGEFTEVR